MIDILIDFARRILHSSFLTITDEPICEKANSNRPLCFAAPSGNMNSGCDCCRIRGSQFRYGENADTDCCRAAADDEQARLLLEESNANEIDLDS